MLNFWIQLGTAEARRLNWALDNETDSDYNIHMCIYFPWYYKGSVELQFPYRFAYRAALTNKEQMDEHLKKSYLEGISDTLIYYP